MYTRVAFAKRVTEMKPDDVQVVIYHHPCTDGFCAAWIARKRLGDGVKLIGVSPDFKNILEDDIRDRNVAIFDVSPCMEVMDRIREYCVDYVLYDHHISGYDRLKDYPNCHFDMQRSGAMLAWDFFYGGEAAPPLVAYVQDRDLWTWKLPDSRKIAMFLSYALPLRMDAWDDAIGKSVGELKESGSIVESVVQNLMNNCYIPQSRLHPELFYFPANDAGFSIACVNGCGVASELGEALLKNFETADVAMVWNRNESSGKIHVSLRSRVGGTDVSRIASLCGGGGHRAASGFIIHDRVAHPLDWLRDKLKK